jgi:hypothetical protein
MSRIIVVHVLEGFGLWLASFAILLASAFLHTHTLEGWLEEPVYCHRSTNVHLPIYTVVGGSHH